MKTDCVIMRWLKDENWLCDYEMIEEWKLIVWLWSGHGTEEEEEQDQDNEEREEADKEDEEEDSAELDHEATPYAPPQAPALTRRGTAADSFLY